MRERLAPIRNIRDTDNQIGIVVKRPVTRDIGPYLSDTLACFPSEYRHAINRCAVITFSPTRDGCYIRYLFAVT